MNPSNILYVATLILTFFFIVSITMHVLIIVYSKSQFRPYLFFLGTPVYLMLWGIAAWYMTILSLIIVIVSLLLIKRNNINIGKELLSKIWNVLWALTFIALIIIVGATLKGLSAWIDNVYADIFSNLFL